MEALLPTGRSARAGEQGQPLGRGGETCDFIGVEVRDDGGEVRRDDLKDRRPHEESRQVVRQVADDLLREVVVELLVRATEAAHEAPDLGRRPVAKRGVY